MTFPTTRYRGSLVKEMELSRGIAFRHLLSFFLPSCLGRSLHARFNKTALHEKSLFLFILFSTFVLLLLLLLLLLPLLYLFATLFILLLLFFPLLFFFFVSFLVFFPSLFFPPPFFFFFLIVRKEEREVGVT